VQGLLAASDQPGACLALPAHELSRTAALAVAAARVLQIALGPGVAEAGLAGLATRAWDRLCFSPKAVPGLLGECVAPRLPQWQALLWPPKLAEAEPRPSRRFPPPNRSGRGKMAELADGPPRRCWRAGWNDLAGI